MSGSMYLLQCSFFERRHHNFANPPICGLAYHKPQKKTLRFETGWRDRLKRNAAVSLRPVTSFDRTPPIGSGRNLRMNFVVNGVVTMKKSTFQNVCLAARGCFV